MNQRIWVGSESIEDKKLPLLWREGAYGSILEFRGCVRNINEGKEVEGMEYEAHLPLAKKSLNEIRNNLLAEFPDVADILIFHRIAKLSLGETSLLVGVASAHRKNAFMVCQKIIDEIKRVTPIWKREFYVDQQAAWLAGNPLNVDVGI